MRKNVARKGTGARAALCALLAALLAAGPLAQDALAAEASEPAQAEEESSEASRDGSAQAEGASSEPAWDGGARQTEEASSKSAWDGGSQDGGALQAAEDAAEGDAADDDEYEYEEFSYLDFKLLEGGKGYEISGYDEWLNPNPSHVEVPAYWQGVPVTRIGFLAFSSEKKIKSVTLHEGLLSIGGSAFSGCGKLEDIEIPDSVREIENDAFYACSALREITLGTGMRKIGDSVFYGSGIRRIVIKEGLEELGGDCDVFNHCSRLESVVLPDTLKKLGKYAFAEREHLREVRLGRGLEEIGEEAFRNCPALESLELPSGLRSIGKGAFKGCTGLRTLSVPASVSKIGEDAFSGCNIRLICKKGSAAAAHAKKNGIGYGDKACTVTFKANGGEKLGVPTVRQPIGANYRLPSARRDGYLLDGWYTKKGGGKKVTEEQKATGSITLYAHWKKPAPGRIKKLAAVSERAGTVKVSAPFSDGMEGTEKIEISCCEGKKWDSDRADKWAILGFPYVDYEMKSGKTYCFRARAIIYDSVGNPHYGKYSNIARVKVL